MAGSLLLLGLFLASWLKSEYEDELESMLIETDHVLISSIRDTEDDYLEQWVHNPLMVHFNDTTFQHKSSSGSITFEGIADIPDTAKIITIGISSNFENMMPDTFSKKIKFNSKVVHENGAEEHDMFKHLSLFMALNDEQLNLDSVRLKVDDSIELITKLETHFETAAKEIDLPVSYKLTRLADSLPQKEKGIFFSRSYTDAMSGERYAVEFSEYRNYLLQQILPQILFSILLFSCISLAFFLIHQSLKRQQKLTELKNDFISNITHELKTPITTVGVAIEALSSFKVLEDPNRTKEYLDISKQELDRLSLLVDKVLKMSLFEKAEPELELEQLDLKELVQEILNSMKLQFEKFAAKVNFQTSGADFSLSGDRSHLMSVIYNLIDNAIKYSPDNPNIEIALENGPAQMTMTVQDHGMGISPEFKNRIFEKFFRVPNGDEHNIKGHGLGLSYVASVIEQHKGTIDVESELGKGTCFTISLPNP